MLHHVRVYPSRLNLASYCDKISVDYTVIKLLLYTEGCTLTMCQSSLSSPNNLTNVR